MAWLFINMCASLQSSSSTNHTTVFLATSRNCTYHFYIALPCPDVGNPIYWSQYIKINPFNEINHAWIESLKKLMEENMNGGDKMKEWLMCELVSATDMELMDLSWSGEEFRDDIAQIWSLCKETSLAFTTQKTFSPCMCNYWMSWMLILMRQFCSMIINKDRENAKVIWGLDY